MKSIIITSVLVLSALKLLGAGACLFFWNPNPSFFAAGGSVTVIHRDGTYYGVSGTVASTNKYTLENDDDIFITPPDCQFYVWGYSFFCPCNNEGGNTCGPANPLAVDAKLAHDIATENCNCPNGSSSAGVSLFAATYCGAPPPPQ